MTRYKMVLAYDGSAYAGWQTQPDARTIQDEVEKAFSRILQKTVNVTGAGRTDSGVHAEGQTAHFDLDMNSETDTLVKGLNAVLPDDIAVLDIQQTPDDFHARFDAVAREYRYQIATQPHPLLKNQVWFCFGNLDTGAMRSAIEVLMGEHDFGTFCKANADVNHTRCNVYDAYLLEEDNGILIFKIRANRFLHHMVRSLVGTLIEIAEHKRDSEEMIALLGKPDRTKVGITAPAKGLILERVFY